MRVVVQRVSAASVSVEGEVVAEIGPGMLVLAGVTPGDTEEDARVIAAKLAGLRVFADDEGKMNLSIVDAEGEALVVSQFTLYGDVRRGRRPSFTTAATPDVAEPLVESLSAELTAQGVPTKTGVFGARMSVALANEGPVTLIVESRDGRVAGS